MSVNKYLSHVFVLPEDDANRQIANGFLLDSSMEARKIQILEEAGGWREVLDRFQSDHVPGMEKYADRFLILLIDFDMREDRLSAARAVIPAHLIERVFVIGAWSEPEQLRQNLGDYETIGKALAKDCRENTETTWAHDLLRHNAEELNRLRQRVRPFLFPRGGQ